MSLSPDKMHNPIGQYFLFLSPHSGASRALAAGSPALCTPLSVSQKEKVLPYRVLGGTPPQAPPKMNFFLRAPSAQPLQILFHPAILVLSLTCAPFDSRFVRKLLMELHLAKVETQDRLKNQFSNAREA